MGSNARCWIIDEKRVKTASGQIDRLDNGQLDAKSGENKMKFIGNHKIKHLYR